MRVGGSSQSPLGLCRRSGGVIHVPLSLSSCVDVQILPVGDSVEVVVSDGSQRLGLDLCGCECLRDPSGGSERIAMGAMIKDFVNPAPVVLEAGVVRGSRIVRIGEVDVKELTFDHVCVELKGQLSKLKAGEINAVKILFLNPPINTSVDAWSNLRWSSAFTARRSGPSTTVVQMDVGHYPTNKTIHQYFVRVHTRTNPATGTTRTVLEPPMVLRNCLPMPLRVTLRQSFPTAKEKETRLPHTVLAGEEMEVYDVNTLAHTFCVISAPSVLRGGCSTEKNAIHIKSIWCDGSETAPTRRPRDREVEEVTVDIF